MLTLWYTVLTYKQYRNTIWDKLSSKKNPGAKETAIVCPLPPSKTTAVDPPKPTPRVVPSQVPVVPSAPQKPPAPVAPKSPEFPVPQQKLDPPPKPPRSPSPHPIKAEALDDIEYEEEEESEEESSEAEDEENSVLATPQRRPVAKTVNEFINKEKAN